MAILGVDGTRDLNLIVPSMPLIIYVLKDFKDPDEVFILIIFSDYLIWDFDEVCTHLWNITVFEFFFD